MSNIYLNSSNWEKLKFSKLWFLKFKKFVSKLTFGELQLKHISLHSKTSCCNLKIKCLGAKAIVVFDHYSFERNNESRSQKGRVHRFCWIKKETIIKEKRNQKWKITQTLFERWTLCVNSYKNHELKI